MNPFGGDKGDKSDIQFKRLLILSMLIYFIFALGIELIPYTPPLKKAITKPRTVKLIEKPIKKTVATPISEDIKKRLEEEKKRRDTEKRLAEENKLKEEQLKKELEKKKAEEQKRLEEEKRRREEEKRKEEERRKAQEKKRAEEEAKQQKEKPKEVAKNAGLLKAMGGGKRFADSVANLGEINRVLDAPSIKPSASGKAGTTGTAGGQTFSQRRVLKGSEGIGDVTGSLAGRQAGNLSGRSEIGGGLKKGGKFEGGGGGGGEYQKTRSKESVKEVLNSHRGSIDFIYRKALRDNPSLKGVIVLELTISPNGSILGVRIVSSNVNDPSFEDQVLKRIQTWKFPPHPSSENTVIKYPLEFSPA